MKRNEINHFAIKKQNWTLLMAAQQLCKGEARKREKKTQARVGLG